MTILKSERRLLVSKNNRDLEKEALWRERINEWKRSPENVAEFCRRREINEHTFRSWQKVLARRDSELRVNRPRPGRKQITTALSSTAGEKEIVAVQGRCGVGFRA